MYDHVKSYELTAEFLIVPHNLACTFPSLVQQAHTIAKLNNPHLLQGWIDLQRTSD